MKTMTSNEVQNSFSSFLDTAQHEPVMVTRKNHPAWIMIPINNINTLFDLVDSMRQVIDKGIEEWLEDVKAGRIHLLTSEYIENLSKKAQKRINSKQSHVWATMM